MSIKEKIERLTTERDFDSILALMTDLRDTLTESYKSKEISAEEGKAITKEIQEALKKNPLYTYTVPN